MYGLSWQWRVCTDGLVWTSFLSVSTLLKVSSSGCVKKAFVQHEATRLTIAPIPTSDLRWSLVCVCRMHSTASEQGLLEPWKGPKPHNLLVEETVLPGWQHSWVENIPIVGVALWLFGWQVWRYTAPYEQVADMLAEDLEAGGEKWVGKKVGYILKEKIKDV